MKIFISADIEGVTGVTVWDEADINKPVYEQFQKQMTAEVVAACEGAFSAGATKICIKDAHGSARNLLIDCLPQEATIIRGWSGHPYLMMQGLDDSFDAAILIGYHAGASIGGNPLSHTLTGNMVAVRINDQPASEFLINTYTAALENVPVVFVSGDQALCDAVKNLNPAMGTVAVKDGSGQSTHSIHPELATQRIRAGVAEVLQDDVSACRVALPEHFTVELQYKEHHFAYRRSFYPGASLIDSYTIRFESDDYFEVLRLLLFVT